MSLARRLYHGDTHVDFVGRRRWWFGVSIGLMVASALAIGIRQLNWSVDFVGGSVFRTTENPAGAGVGEIRDALAAVGQDSARIQLTRSTVDDSVGVRVQTEELTVEEQDRVVAALRSALEVGYTHFDTAESYADGHSEELVGRAVRESGKKREEVFIGNVLKCRPPDNRDPRPDEIINCLPYLQRQIEILNPEIIVALGAHAARTLLNTNRPIGQLRGEFHEYFTGIGRPPIKLMATYHTAYLLRNYTPDNRRRVWEDMKKVLAELGLPVPERGKGS